MAFLYSDNKLTSEKMKWKENLIHSSSKTEF